MTNDLTCGACFSLIGCSLVQSHAGFSTFDWLAWSSKGRRDVRFDVAVFV